MTRLAVILSILLLAGCGNLEQIRADYLAENPDTAFAKEIEAGRVVVGMSEYELCAASPQMRIRYDRETATGWVRIYMLSGLSATVRDGYVTAVSWSAY